MLFDGKPPAGADISASDHDLPNNASQDEHDKVAPIYVESANTSDVPDLEPYLSSIAKEESQDISLMPRRSLPTVEIDEKKMGAYGLRAQGSDIEAIERQFRRIKRPIINSAFGQHSGDTRNSNIVMVVSPLAGSGKTFCSFNLAMSIARERDIGVLMVDADVLRPSLSRGLGAEKCVGLVDYLHDDSIHLENIVLSNKSHNLLVIPAGKPNAEATELLASRRMRDFVAVIASQYSDCAIIFDTPPLLATNEAHVLAQHAGQLVFVIEAGVTSHDCVHQAVSLLDDRKPINAILNKTPNLLYGETYHDRYRYEYEPPDEET